MREKYLWLAIIVLTVLTLGQACYIYDQNAIAKDIYEELPGPPEIVQKGYSEKAYDAQWNELEKWRKRVREQINQGLPLAEPDFDDFFNDRFFAGRLNPFAEMERVRRQMSDEFRDMEKKLFDDYWDNWFEQRMMLGRFDIDVKTTEKAITLTLQVPGLSAKTADINITNDRIKIAFSARTSVEEKSAGGIVKRSALRSYLKILPVPEEAAPGTGKIETDGERVKIIFDRKAR
jgi:HSP20 family molecular chaperone IbpA